MAQQALRVLASAYRDLDTPSPTDLTPESVERELVFVGLTGMYDPPRPEAKDAVAKCRAAGIRVVMITGDHPDTATAIAREIGLASNDEMAVAGVELDRMSDEELRKRVPRIAVYARVTAEHKLRIIRAWKANDAVVAMTGDGVNDAPAIKGSDIGIAMGKSGTEVTKQASDMIITDDNFSSIVAAVEEGRGIYDNIRKTLQYLLAGNTGELLLMTFCVVAGFPAPLLPIHLLWINLVTDGLPALCLATDPIDPEVMKRHPRRRSERITDRSFLRSMGLTGFLTASVAFAVYFYALKKATRKQPAPMLSPFWSSPNSCAPSVPEVKPSPSGASLSSQTSASPLWFPFPSASRCGASTTRSGPLPEVFIHAVHRLSLAACPGKLSHCWCSSWRSWCGTKSAVLRQPANRSIQPPPARASKPRRKSQRR